MTHSLYRIVVLGISLFWASSLLVWSTNPYKPAYNAVEIGMGKTSLAYYEGGYHAFHNQGLLTYSNKFYAGVNFVNQYRLNELNMGSIAFTAPIRNFALGALYFYSGNSNFHRQMVGIATGISLSERISVGIQIDYFNEHYGMPNSNVYAISFELGSAIKISENTTVAIHLFNPIPPSLLESFLPSSAEIGIGTHVGRSLFIAAEANIDTFDKIFEAKAGFDYEVFTNLFLRAGFVTTNSSFCFGIGYKIEPLSIDIALCTHETLGNTFAASLAFNW